MPVYADLAEFQKKGNLTSNLMDIARIQFNDKVHGQQVTWDIPAKEQKCLITAGKKIYQTIKKFEEEVWFKGGLQDYILKARKKKHQAGSYGLTVMTYANIGRVMITLQDKRKGISITLITLDEEHCRCMRLQSIEGRLFDAVWLIKEATRHFKHDRLKFTLNNNISMI